MPQNEPPELDSPRQDKVEGANPIGLLYRLSDHIRNLPPGQQLAGIAILALASLIAVTIVGDDPPSRDSTLLIIFFAGLVALVIGAIPTKSPVRRSFLTSPGLLAGTITIVAVCVLFGISMTRGSETGSKTINGNVYSGNRPVRQAIVSIDGHAVVDTTDNVGLFRISVPRTLLAQHEQKYNGNVAFRIFLADTVVVPVRADVEHPPVELRLENKPVARLAPAGVYSQVAWRIRPGNPQEDRLTLRVILDSVRVLHDGSVGSSRWQFNVNTNERDTLFAISENRYSDAAGNNLVVMPEEGIANVESKGRIRLLISGRRTALFSRRWAFGWSHSLELGRMVPNTAYRTSATVTASEGDAQGSFVFYFTLVPISASRVTSPAANSGGGALREESEATTLARS